MTNNRGFLLFEVMVSIVIVTAGILFIAHSYSSSTDSIKRSTDAFRASLLLQNRMWPLEQSGTVREGLFSGDFPEDKNFSWQINAEYMADSDLNYLRLEVFQEKEPEKTKYSIETYLMRKSDNRFL